MHTGGRRRYALRRRCRGGGIPIFLETERNAYGLIGPIFSEAFDEARIRDKIRNHPLVADKEAWRRERPFRVAVIEQCTYDGTIYSAERIVERIGGFANTSCSMRPGRAS